MHVPNDDRRLPGRQLSQISHLGNTEEGAVSSIETHHGKGADALFSVLWKAGDRAWLPYHEISYLEAMTQYLKAQGVNSISQLPWQILDETSLPIACIHPHARNIARCLAKDTISWAGGYEKWLNGKHPDWVRVKTFKPCASGQTSVRDSHSSKRRYAAYRGRVSNLLPPVPALASSSRDASSLHEENSRLKHMIDELKQSANERPRKLPKHKNRVLDNRAGNEVLTNRKGNALDLAVSKDMAMGTNIYLVIAYLFWL